MTIEELYHKMVNEKPVADVREMYEGIGYYCTFNDGKCSGSGYEEELSDEKKIRYCTEECIGLDYCGGSREDGSDCPRAPSVEAVNKIWEEKNTCDRDYAFCDGKGCKFTYCINNLNI